MTRLKLYIERKKWKLNRKTYEKYRKYNCKNIRILRGKLVTFLMAVDYFENKMCKITSQSQK